MVTYLRIKNALRFSLDLFRLPFAMLRLFLNPNNVDPIFDLGTFRRHPAFKVAEDKILNNPETAAIFQERYLHPGYYDVEKLSMFPPGTLGHAYGKFMKERNLKADFYRPYVDPNNDVMAYARKRCPQTHDLWHLVVGADTDDLGEMKISAFYVAQIRSPFNALFIGIGLFVGLFKQPDRLGDFFDAVTEGWILGKQAKPLFAVKWENFWEKSFSEVRKELNLPEVATGVSAVNL